MSEWPHSQGCAIKTGQKRKDKVQLGCSAKSYKAAAPDESVKNTGMAAFQKNFYD